MKIFEALASTMLAATIALSPAAAVVKVATYAGTLSEGIDETGEFGAPNTNLAGKTFVEKFIYNTSLGRRATTATDDVLKGGATFFSVSPILSATVTVGGITRAADTLGFTDVITSLAVNNGLEKSYFAITSQKTVFNPTVYTQSEISIQSYLAIDFRTVDTNFSAPIDPKLGSGFNFFNFDFLNRIATRKAHGESTDGILTISDAAPSAAPVPEPAAWTLMIVGLAAVGILARRRGALPA